MELEDEKNLMIQRRNTNSAFQKAKRDTLASMEASLQQLKNDRAAIKAMMAEPGKIEMTLSSEMKKEKELAKTVEADVSMEKEVLLQSVVTNSFIGVTNFICRRS